MNPIHDETQFDRWTWLTLTAVVVFTAVVLVNTFAILSMPGDGWQLVYDEATLAHFVGDWPTPLQVGDVLLAVDGLPYSATNLRPLPQPANWAAGATVPYIIERAGRQETVEVSLGRLSPQQLLRAVGNSMRTDLPQWSWFVTALVVFFLRPSSSAARLLLIATASQTVATKIGWAATTSGQAFAPPPIWVLHFLADTFWGWLFFPALILLLLTFPLPIWPVTRFPRLTPTLLFSIPLGVTMLVIPLGQAAPATILLGVEALLIFAAAVMAVLRTHRHSQNRVVRAQVGWVALGIGVTIGGTLLFYLLDYVGVIQLEGGLLEDIFTWPLTLALPVCLAIAILRFRLFDIEVIIRKTLVYTTLTALLGLVYFGSVVLLQQVFRALTGEKAQIAIVASTLLIAALFAPLRRRIQDLIDRRFYRRKYDAQQALAAFAARARDETDVEALTGELVRVVGETMQPAHVSVWLKPMQPSPTRRDS